MTSDRIQHIRHGGSWRFAASLRAFFVAATFAFCCAVGEGIVEAAKVDTLPTKNAPDKDGEGTILTIVGTYTSNSIFVAYIVWYNESNPRFFRLTRSGDKVVNLIKFDLQKPDLDDDGNWTGKLVHADLEQVSNPIPMIKLDTSTASISSSNVVTVNVSGVVQDHLADILKNNAGDIAK